MTDTILDKDTLVANIRTQIENSDQLKYQRALLEFFDNDGRFLGDNVFETSFMIRQNQPPVIYEVSGPYDAVSNEYATVGRIYESGKLVFECDIKQQIQQRTAAIVWLFFSALDHKPKRILFVGAGKLAIHTVHYLKHFLPDLSALDYHDINQRVETFEDPCGELGVSAKYRDQLELGDYDTIIMATNTTACLIDNTNIASVRSGAVVVSLCTTSQTGEIASDVYGHDDVNVMFDYELTRSFTPDMRAADRTGNLKRVVFLSEILRGKAPQGIAEKKNLLRLTGTPMQNVAVLNMMRSL